VTSTKIVGLAQNKLDRYSKAMTPEQCRAARAWLDLPQAELAAAAKVGLSTLRDFETGRRTPIANNLAAIAAVFAARGIAFFVDDDGSSGVRHSPSRT